MKKLLFCLSVLSTSLLSPAQTPVCTANGYHLMDEDGDFLTKTAYTYIDKTNPRIFLAYNSGSYYYLNSNGKSLYPYGFSLAYPFKGNFALAYKNGQYFHITPTGLYLDSLDWPKAPEVYNTHLLISRDQKKVIHHSGKVVHTYADSLVFGENSGIVLWDTAKKTAQQFFNYSGLPELNKGKSFRNVVKVDNTQQGYVVVVQEKKGEEVFCVLNNRGDVIIENEPAIRYYKTLRVVRDKYVFTAEDGTTARIATPWDFTHWYPLKYLKSKYYNYNNSALAMSSRKELSPFGLLLGSEKWALKSNGTVSGNYLFDQVLPAKPRTRNYPVKMGMQWHFYNSRTESVDSLPFKEIHPMGLYNDMMFVSDTAGVHPNKKWALYNVKTKQLTVEMYTLIPPRTRHIKLLTDRVYNPWFNDILEVNLGKRKVYFNEYGEEIFKEPENAPSYEMLNFYEYELLVTRKNMKPIPKGNKFSKKQLELKLSANNGLALQMANNTKADIPITWQDGIFQLSLQYERTPGKWETICGPPNTDCGNSYVPGKFPAQQLVEERIPMPQGSSRVKLRMVLTDVNGIDRVYSNSIWYSLPFAFLTGYFPPYGAQQRFMIDFYRRNK